MPMSGELKKRALPFGKAQTMLVEQIRVFEDVVENVLQHEFLVVPPAEEALVVLCHLVSVLHRPQSASGWDKITHAEHTEKQEQRSHASSFLLFSGAIRKERCPVFCVVSGVF